VVRSGMSLGKNLQQLCYDLVKERQESVEDWEKEK